MTESDLSFVMSSEFAMVPPIRISQALGAAFSAVAMESFRAEKCYHLVRHMYLLVSTTSEHELYLLALLCTELYQDGSVV